MAKNDTSWVYFITIKQIKEVHSMAKKETERQEQGLNEYGIIYLTGAIDDGIAENIGRQIIEHNIKGV